ncbi:MAG: NifU family protein [Sporichthyaceae bacterium]
MGAPKLDVGERVEALLAQLRRQGGDPAADSGEELVRELLAYYGAGLERITEIVAAGAPELLAALAADPLVESQLLLHGVHPLGVEERITAALDALVPPAGDAVYLGIDVDGVAHLRLPGTGKGCSTGAAKAVLAETLLAAAPELTDVEVATEETAKPLIQIGRRPGLVAVR